MIEYVETISETFYECLDLIGHYTYIFFPFIFALALIFTAIEMVLYIRDK